MESAMIADSYGGAGLSDCIFFTRNKHWRLNWVNVQK